MTTPKEALAERLEQSEAEMLKVIAERMDRARSEMRQDLIMLCQAFGARPDEIEAVLAAFDEDTNEKTRH